MTAPFAAAALAFVLTLAGLGGHGAAWRHGFSHRRHHCRASLPTRSISPSRRPGHATSKKPGPIRVLEGQAAA